MQAVNGAGLSDFSEPWNCSTLPAPADEVRNFKHERDNEVSVFSWSLPCRSNGKIEKFIVEVEPQDYDKMLIFEVPSRDNQEFFEITRRDAMLNSTNGITVRAVNGKIHGKSKTLSRTTSE